jgi:hypothetical protein
MKRYQIHKRTFEARQHEKNSPERIELNKSAITSEYMPSYKYQIIGTMGNGGKYSSAYRTKREAEMALSKLNN